VLSFLSCLTNNSIRDPTASRTHSSLTVAKALIDEMGPKKKSNSPSPAKASNPAMGQKKAKDLPPSAGFLISCDVPTKQYIQYLNELKPVDKKFIIEDLDATHLLVKKKARDEIERKVEAWMDENVFSAVERVGENLDVS
jgi:TFIIH basal transcription factor complex TTD-A subunit